MSAYRIILLVIIIAGLIPGVVYLFTFRPYRNLTLTHLDSSGWVPLFMILYVIAGMQTVAGVNHPPVEIGSAIPRLLLGIAIDAALWLRLVRWWNFRQMYQDYEKNIPDTTGESESSAS